MMRAPSAPKASLMPRPMPAPAPGAWAPSKNFVKGPTGGGSGTGGARRARAPPSTPAPGPRGQAGVAVLEAARQTHRVQGQRERDRQIQVVGEHEVAQVEQTLGHRSVGLGQGGVGHERGVVAHAKDLVGHGQSEGEASGTQPAGDSTLRLAEQHDAEHQADQGQVGNAHVLHGAADCAHVPPVDGAHEHDADIGQAVHGESLYQCSRGSASRASGGHASHLPAIPVSYTHLRAHETVLDLVFLLLLEKKKHKI